MENTTKAVTELIAITETKSNAGLKVANELNANVELNIKIAKIEKEIQPALYEQSLDQTLIKAETK